MNKFTYILNFSHRRFIENLSTNVITFFIFSSLQFGRKSMTSPIFRLGMCMKKHLFTLDKVDGYISKLSNDVDDLGRMHRKLAVTFFGAMWYVRSIVLTTMF